MTTFKINLIRGRAMNAGRRRLVFVGILAYLAAVGVAMVVMAYISAVNYERIVDFKYNVKVIKTAQDGLPSAEKDISRYARGMRDMLAGYTDNLESIAKVTSRFSEPAVIVKAISAGLPSDTFMDNLHLDNDTGKFDFDIIMPADAGKAHSGTQSLVAFWKKEESLAPYLDTIDLVLTRKETRSSQPVTVAKFSGQLKKGAK